MASNKQKFPRKSNRILQQNEFRLLLNSRAIEEFSWLKALLQEKENKEHPYLTKNDAMVLPVEHQHFLRNFRNDLITTASNEWTCDKGYLEDHGGRGTGGEWPYCKLCNTPNRYEFCIVNRENENRLNVGSSCILHFGIDTGGRSIPQMKRDAKKLRREHEVDLQVRDVKRLVTHWDNHLNSYPILIPDPHDGDYRELGKQFRSCFEKYTDPKSKHNATDLNQTVSELKRLLQESKELKEKMAVYANTHENDQFVVTRDIVKWVQRLDIRESRLIFNSLKKDGHIIAPTAHRITEPGFMQSIVQKLNDQLRNISLQVQNIDTDQPGYILATTDKPVIALVISHRNLLLAVGAAVFDNKQSVERSEVIKHCKIANDRSRDIVRAKFAKALADRFSEPSLSDDFENIREEFNEWVLIDNSSQRIIIVEDLASVLDQYIAGDLDEEQFVRNLHGPRVRRYKRDEFQELYSNRIHNR